MALQTCCSRRRLVVDVSRRDVCLVLVIVVLVYALVHQPFVVAVHRNLYVRVRSTQRVQLGKRRVKLRRTTRVQNHHVALLCAERLGEHRLRRLQVGYVVRNALSLKTAAQCGCEHTLVACRVVAVDKHRMRILEAVHERVYRQFGSEHTTLINLEDMVVGLHVATVDRERDDETYAVLAAEVAYRFHLLGVERTEDKVAVLGVGVGKHLRHAGILMQVPSEDVGVDALTAQTVARHEHATVVFYHALSVAVHVVQRQHHAHVHRVSRTLLCCRRLRRRCCSSGLHLLRERNEQLLALLQHIVVLLHVGVCLHQLVDGDAELLGDAIYRVFLLYLIQVLPLRRLRRHRRCQQHGAKQEKNSNATSHFYHSIKINIAKVHKIYCLQKSLFINNVINR